MSGERFTGLPGKPAGGSPDLARSLGGGLRPGRAMLLGCGALLFLLGIAALVFLLKADDFVGWVFGSVEETMAERLPPDLPEEERARLDRAFAAATANLESGEGDTAALRRLQSKLVGILRSADDRPLTREEVAEITAALEEIAGTAVDPNAPATAVPGARSGPDSDRP
ncbi:MAG TPA: hypothetical protein VF100_05600 [Thermoanaerobaculia bacterium]